ncbi:MAG: hypothetical protein FWF59_01555 [Turicibacter sp.]|nr:hypothetical protein [Turicibacter sp.]
MKKWALMILMVFLAAFEGDVVHFQMNGLGGMVSVPKGEGGHPIVFIVGDPGLELLDALSGEDYLTVLLNEGDLAHDAGRLSALFETYRMGLFRWLTDESPELGQDLVGKGDFSWVALIGVGEYADGVLEIAKKHHQSTMEIAHVMLLAPSRHGQSPLDGLPDIPISILLPQSLLEENIVSLTYFQKLRQDPVRTADAAIYFTQAHGHGFTCFAKEFAASRLREIFMGAPQIAGLHASLAAPSELFQIRIKSALASQGDTRILDPSRFADPHEHAFGKTIYTGIDANHFKGLTDIYQLTGGPQSSLKMAFDEAMDLSVRESMSIYFNYANPQNTPLSFFVEFRDLEGQVECAEVGSQSPFNYGAGALIPFYQERIVLSGLQNVDLTSIESITLHFRDGISGEFNIGDISMCGYKKSPDGEY